MSRAASPFAGRLYGVVRVTREWEMARSSFYYQLRIAAQPQRVLRRRGPKTECSDETLTGKIREVLAASPFYGEGHRKVWARLRMAGGARRLRRIPRGGRGRHSQPARPRQPVPERRLPSGDRLPGHAIFAFLRAPTGMQWLRGAVHPHAERAIPVGAHVSERGRVAAWPGGISRALQSALDRPALGVPHARPGSPAASCTWSRCMNTLSSVS